MCSKLILFIKNTSGQVLRRNEWEIALNMLEKNPEDGL
jgi:hypothetical protein